MGRRTPVANETGLGQPSAAYRVPDDQLPAGSTLGGAKVMTMIKANGSIEKVYGIDSGAMLLGTLMLRHYDALTGMHLAQHRAGTYVLHPAHQEHFFSLINGISVREDIFALNSRSPGEDVDPPGVYYMVELRNDTPDPVEIITYAFAVLRGGTDQDVRADYQADCNGLIAWNASHPNQARIVGCSEKPESYETTLDFAKGVAQQCPGRLSCTTDAKDDPLGVLQHRHCVEPGSSARFCYLVSIGKGRDDAVENYHACPPADSALQRTVAHFNAMLSRSVVSVPDPYVNRGVLWAKANTLRVMTKAPTGWAFTNDPTRSNNSVARDTAWFGYGADYLVPEFVKDALLAYVRLQEPSGEIVEYYDIRTDKTEDYGLNINDDTPLLIVALWHHYTVTGDEDFLKQVYPAAAKAARYILSQRNDKGLVWCTATGTADYGICGWRNVIPGYRLSGATTEVNSECFAALETVSQMARVLGKHKESLEFERAAGDLKQAINTHLYNSDNGLYYLNIDLNGEPRTDVTSDLVFPIIFQVASEETATAIIARLSNQDFWTSAGMRTTPRDSPMYTPNLGWGLLGGVWVGVAFWYAFAAAKYAPDFMAYALSTTFRTYSENPLRHNTVPGQFSEWLDGETLVNRGMMLSPWFPPRYLWAAIEGMAGFSILHDSPQLAPRLAPDWKWLGVRELPYRDQRLTWFVVRAPHLQIYTSFSLPGSTTPYVAYDEDITSQVKTVGQSICTIGLRQGQDLLLFAGNTDPRAVTGSLRVRGGLGGKYRIRRYNSLIGEWREDDDLVDAETIHRGLTVELEHKGFCLFDIRQEV